MNAPNKQKNATAVKTMKSEIAMITKDIIHLDDSDEFELEIRPPGSQLFEKQKESEKDSKSLYKNRRMSRGEEKIRNLDHQPNGLILHNNVSFYSKTTRVSAPLNITPQKEKRDNEKISQKKILMQSQKSITIVQKTQRSFISNTYESKTSSAAIQRQLQAINELNKPQWVSNKQRRKAINQEKYPNSYTHSYEYSEYLEFSSNNNFSAMNKKTDNAWKKSQQVRQKNFQKNKQKRQEENKKRIQRQIQEKKKMQQKRIADIEETLGCLIDQGPKKKHKGEEYEEQGNGDGGLGNKDALNTIMAEERQNADCVNDVARKSQARVGAKDNIEYQTTAHPLINMVLQHDYGKESIKSQTKKIPDVFPDKQTYRKTFHYLIAHECIAEVRHKLRTIQKGEQQCFKVSIKYPKTNTNGQVEIFLSHKEMDQTGAIQLKNFSFSRSRLGLICSSRQYKKEYYGVRRRKIKQFAFVVLLTTPTTTEELEGLVRVKAKIKANDLEQLLARRQKQTVYFFDLEKLSTIFREYLAVTNVVCSNLSSSILDPRLVEEEVGRFVQNEQVLNGILTILKKHYNQTQWQSIREMVLRKRGFVLLQGPPGTGKTSTLMGLLAAQYEYLRKTQDTRKIMICAPSNAAVDHIIRRIRNQGLFTSQGDRIHPRILRTGIIDNTDPCVVAVSLDHQSQKEMIANREEASKLIMIGSAQIKEKIIQIQKQMRRPQVKDDQVLLAAKKQQLIQYEQMNFNFKKQKFITSRVKYQNIENKLFKDAEIVLTTLASSGTDKIDKIRGDIACLIVDQAAQATEPNLLIALQTGVEKVLLIGDPYQLPATCKSNDSNVTLFNRSLFERFLDADIKPYFLNIQYRMSPIIRGFPSSRFYNDRLIDAENVIQRPIPSILQNFENRNLLFIDLQYGTQERNGDSFCNYAQSYVVSLLISCLMDSKTTLGLITPYQSQKRAIFKDCMEILRGKQVERQFLQREIMINTVDSFQGQEKDIIIVSTVRANAEFNVGFLTDERRINVTLTRAKHLLVVIGHGDTLGSNEVWDDFLTQAEKRNCYYQINKKRDVDQVLSNFFAELNFKKIQRKRHAKLSTDIRNFHRNQIKSIDFQPVRQLKPTNQKDIIENQSKFTMLQQNAPQEVEEKVIIFNKYAMNLVDSQKILEEKKLKEEEQRNFLLMMERMKRLQQENQARMK